MPHLEFCRGDQPLFLHPLRSGRTLLGRSDRCDIALPDEALSRVHCLVEEREGAWWVIDRSRHGTQVNQETVQDRRRLAPGDTLTLGSLTARFHATPSPLGDAPTSATPALPATHEELVEVDGEGVAASRAHLRFVEGPLTGHSVTLERSRTTLGGPGADIVLADDLPARAVALRVVRGRVMVEPGAAPVWLAGTRVRELTPTRLGERIRLGDHTLAVEEATVREPVERALFGDMVGNAPVMRRLFGVLTRMAAHDHPVLLTGESGTGKELAARGLHDGSPRYEGPFVAVNCAAIAPTLFESELFGHEKGSFTGATERSPGAFQRADGGTLFLDEVGELELEAQAKLLRALESGEVRRVGGKAPEFPDVRVVAATNRDLGAMVREGTFRQDLLFRLAVLTVQLPSLRERAEDVPLLARTLLERLHPDATLTPAGAQCLRGHRWPGNVRELRNVLTRAYVLGGSRLDADTLEFDPWSFTGPGVPVASEPDDEERQVVSDALVRCRGNRTRAAALLGLPRSTLLYKMKKYGLS